MIEMTRGAAAVVQLLIQHGAVLPTDMDEDSPASDAHAVEDEDE